MDAATVSLLVIVAIIVAAIAANLIAIAASLRKITRTLSKVRGGVVAIKGQTDPVGEVIGGVAADVATIDDDLEGLLELVGQAQAAAAAEAARPKPAPRRPPVRRSPPPAPVEDIVDFDTDDDDDIAGTTDRRPSMREAVARARAGA